LRLQFPVADKMLLAWDSALGFNGLAIVEALLAQGRWIFVLMSPAYNYTLDIFLGSFILLAMLGKRIEAWRAIFCFVGTLLTTCLIAIFVPAKGLGMWASADLLAQLPDRAMRSFWPHFDQFYFNSNPVLHLRVIDGVISFPSFHTVVGFLVLAMWRKNLVTLALAAAWLFFMLLATFPGGGHYVVDLIGGFIVWAAWFAGSRQVEQSVARKLAPSTA
jgi:membrane-associated phospholipid phosphatase